MSKRPEFISECSTNISCSPDNLQINVKFIVNLTYFNIFKVKIYVSLRLRVQNAVPAQPCVGKLEISLVLLNFFHCNFR